MAIQVDAVYENGVLKPLRPLDLAEHEQVVVVIKQAKDESHYDLMENDTFLDKIRKKLEANPGPIPTREDARKILSKIPGSLSEEILESRGPR